MRGRYFEICSRVTKYRRMYKGPGSMNRLQIIFEMFKGAILAIECFFIDIFVLNQGSFEERNRNTP